MTTENNSTFLNRNLINKLKSEPLDDVNLKLEGYADNAEMALTLVLLLNLILGHL